MRAVEAFRRRSRTRRVVTGRRGFDVPFTKIRVAQQAGDSAVAKQESPARVEAAVLQDVIRMSSIRRSPGQLGISLPSSGENKLVHPTSRRVLRPLDADAGRDDSVAAGSLDRPLGLPLLPPAGDGADAGHRHGAAGRCMPCQCTVAILQDPSSIKTRTRARPGLLQGRTETAGAIATVGVSPGRRCHTGEELGPIQRSRSSRKMFRSSALTSRRSQCGVSGAGSTKSRVWTVVIGFSRGRGLILETEQCRGGQRRRRVSQEAAAAHAEMVDTELLCARGSEC